MPMKKEGHVSVGHMSLLALGLMGFFISQPLLAHAMTGTETTSVATNLGLYGGELQNFAIDPTTGTIFTTTLAPSGIFRSEDQGTTWTGLPDSTNYGTGKVVVVDSDNSLVYGLIGDSLLQSSDDGLTWTDITANLEQSAFGNTMYYGQGRLIVSSNTGHVYVSDDQGATFTENTVLDGATLLSFASANTSDVYYVSLESENTTYLFTSVDGGETWTDMDVAGHGWAGSVGFGSVAVSPTDDNHLVLNTSIPDSASFHTFDAGDTWIQIGNTTDNRIAGGCLAFDSVGRLYIGRSYTDDATVEAPTWSSLDPATPESQIYGDVCAVDPSDDNTLYMNTTLGVAVSTDRGETWSDVVNGITSVKSYAIAQSVDKTTVWIGANGGLAKTTNFTDLVPTWEYPISPEGNGSTVKAVWVDPSDANHVVVAPGTTFMYTTDGGSSWTSSTMSAVTGTIVQMVASRVDSNTLYAVYYYDDLAGTDVGGVLMSTDAGSTWTSLNLTGDLPATTLTVASDDTLYVGVGGDATNPGVYMYDGATWSALSGGPNGLPISSVLLDPTDDQRLFVTNSDSEAGGLYVTEDGGSTWSQPNTGLESIVNMRTLTSQSSGSNTYYISGQDGETLNGVVYKSTDGGNTWWSYYTGLKQESFYALFFDGLMAANDRGVYDVKTLGRFRKLSKVQEGDQVTYRFSLKDAATGKKLQNKAVRVFKKKNGAWTRIRTLTTNAKGRVHFTVNSTKVKRLKLRWRPSGNAANAYTTSVSSIYKVNN